jgi:hypothetical protein
VNAVPAPVRFLLALASAVLTLCLLASAQNVPPPRLPPVTGQPDQDQRELARMQREMAKKANKERQAAIKRDTDKLLELATQLKENVDKSSEDTLSLDVIRKAGEIEKLAHSVKEKMKGN